MYTEYFGLTDSPFSIAPNPLYLFMSQRHQEALAHLNYGIQYDGGFILLTGEVGTGKTTLCRQLLQEMPAGVEVAFVLNPRVSTTELLATVCDEFEIEYPDDPSNKILVDLLAAHLLSTHAEGKHSVLIIDEAQNLSRDLLEQLRLLTNLETNERKLLQILLLGQPELLDILEQENLRQFAQRITARFHLDALNKDETRQYINHRLGVAGGHGSLFRRSAMNRIYKISGGIPRVINLICDRALLGAYAEGKPQVNTRMVNQAAKEVLGKLPPSLFPNAAIAASFLVIVIISGWQLASHVPAKEDGPLPVTVTATPEEPVQLKGHATLERAYHDLFALWGAAFAENQAPACSLAPSIGLRCHHQRASLENIITLNRPVLVETSGGYLTVSNVSEKTVTLIAEDRQYELSHGQFLSQYDGQVHLFWRSPPAYSQPLRIQDTGAAVDWLVIQLSLIEGSDPPMEAGFVYNEELASQVKNFQASVGLVPDGIVDPLTWIHLNSVDGINIPTLSSDHRG